MKTVWRLVEFLRPFWMWVFLSFLLGTATVAAGIGLLGTSAALISRAALQPSIASLQVAIVGVRFFGISRAFFRYMERLVSHSVNFKLLAHLRTWFYTRLEPLAPAGLTDLQGGDLLNRAIADIETLENFYIRVIAPPAVAVITILWTGIFVGGILPAAGWVLVVGLAATTTVVPVLTYLVSKNYSGDVIRERSRLNSHAVAGLQGLADIIANGQQGRLVAEIQSASLKQNQAQFMQALAGAGANSIHLLFTNLTLAGVLWFSIPPVLKGSLDGTILAVLALITVASFEAAAPLGQAAQNLDNSLRAAGRLFELADRPVPVPGGSKSDILEKPSRCEIRRLFFSFPSTSSPVLQDINLDLAIGKKIALVGPSASGKTTLFDILLRFRNYETGQILIDGLDIQTLQPERVRQCFAVMDQVPFLFSATLRQNLRLADDAATDEEILKGLYRAGLKNWYENLPAGLDSWIGELGQSMSGGERQRVAMARTLLQNRPFILLDEPTANLDPVLESRIMDDILDLFTNKGLIWITHHLVKMEKFDEICFLEGGRIMERGSHADLVARGGKYYRAWQVQQRIYRD